MSRRQVALLGAALLALAVPATAADDPLAPTGRWSANIAGHTPVPPMGWNSWNAFNSDVDEEKVLASAQALVDTGLARLGYRYVNIDDDWWLKRRESDGRLVIRTSHFPSAATGPNPSFRPSPQAGAIVFEIWGDGRLLARSSPKRFGQPAEVLTAEVSEVKIVELVARAQGAASPWQPQPASWGDAALLR